jgi:hypothetical protein
MLRNTDAAGASAGVLASAAIQYTREPHQVRALPFPSLLGASNPSGLSRVRCKLVWFDGGHSRSQACRHSGIASGVMSMTDGTMSTKSAPPHSHACVQIKCMVVCFFCGRPPPARAECVDCLGGGARVRTMTTTWDVPSKPAVDPADELPAAVDAKLAAAAAFPEPAVDVAGNSTSHYSRDLCLFSFSHRPCEYIWRFLAVCLPDVVHRSAGRVYQRGIALASDMRTLRDYGGEYHPDQRKLALHVDTGLQ